MGDHQSEGKTLQLDVPNEVFLRPGWAADAWAAPIVRKGWRFQSFVERLPRAGSGKRKGSVRPAPGSRLKF